MSHIQKLEAKETHCKGCRRPIIWGETLHAGKGPLRPIPLDARTMTRAVVLDGVVHIGTTYYPHHASCPCVYQFRAKKERAKSFSVLMEERYQFHAFLTRQDGQRDDTPTAIGEVWYRLDTSHWYAGLYPVSHHDSQGMERVDDINNFCQERGGFPTKADAMTWMEQAREEEAKNLLHLATQYRAEMIKAFKAGQLSQEEQQRVKAYLTHLQQCARRIGCPTEQAALAPSPSEGA